MELMKIECTELRESFFQKTLDPKPAPIFKQNVHGGILSA